ncbi:MAG TPA: type 4a pilus biogenesis protein PilO [Desulfomonilaceae bacterium]|nr:type 4a pilus biogenesis protein PilO [Desulfomonilaceae bacterium]
MALAPNEIFFKLTRIQRLLIVLAIVLLLMVGFYFLFISDMRDQIATLEVDIGRLDVDIINQKNILAEKPKLLAQITELEQRLQAMVASLPEKQEIEVLLKRITDLLSESNLVAKRFVPLQERIDEELFYATIPIQLNVRGDYHKQGQFLSSLNDLPRIVNVPSLRLGKAGGLTSRESDLAKKLEIIALDADINGETYRRLSQEEIKAITQKKAAQRHAPPPAKRK